jgi:hypothetical protein
VPVAAVARRGSVGGAGDGGVLLGGRGRRVGQLRRCLTVWFAALLALAPFVRPALPVVAAARAAPALEEFVAREAAAKQPAAGLIPAQPVAPGILSRLAALETTLGPPPVKPPLLRPRAERPRPASQAAPTAVGAMAGGLQRSAVGTARTPTGPPA